MPSVYEPEFSETAFMGDVLRELMALRDDPVVPILPSQAPAAGDRAVAPAAPPLPAFPFRPRRHYEGIETQAGILYRLRQDNSLAPQGWILRGFSRIWQVARHFRPLLLLFRTSVHVARMHGGLTEAMVHPRFGQGGFYRMRLRGGAPGTPHALAVQAAGSALGPLGYYCTPNYHSQAERLAHAEARAVLDHVSFFDPAHIGAIADGKAHHVSFRPGSGSFWRFSDQPVMVADGRLDLPLLRAGLATGEELPLDAAGLGACLRQFHDIRRQADPASAPAMPDLAGWTEREIGSELAQFAARHFDAVFCLALRGQAVEGG